MRSHEKILLIQRRRNLRGAAQARQKRRWRAALLAVLATLGTLTALALIALGWAYVEITKDLPAVDELPVLLDPQHGALLQPTRLYDRSGQHLIYSLENPGILRRPLPIDPSRSESLSPALIQIVLAVQDPDFLSQPMLRLNDLNNPQPATIAERLVADLLLWDERPGLRKTLRLRLLANQALTRYGRLQVLEWYLNNASFGHLAYGADAAAQLYLGKPASQLDWAEAALLGAALEAPALNPLDSPAAAVERQHEVLGRLLQAGVIDQTEVKRALLTPLTLRSSPPQPASTALAFSIRTLDQLTRRIDRQRLERGGLRITTSLDYDLQVQLKCTLQTQLVRLNTSESPVSNEDECQAGRLLPAPPMEMDQISASGLSASAVILDPQTGQVLAMAGDTSLMGGESPSLKPHPAGSLQSPFLALAGFARSLSPASLVWDIPDSLKGYPNPDGQFLGPLRLRSALANNRLVPLTQVLLQIGPINMLNAAHSLGLKSLELPPDERDTFFQGETADPLEAAFAFSAFANLGLLNGQAEGQSSQISPILVLRVEDAGGGLELSNEISQSQPVVSAQLSYLVHNVLSDEPARWPSLGYPNPLEIGRPAGAMTGETADGASTWAVGYTPQRVALVWLGTDSGQNSPPLDPRLAAGVWHALIQYANRDLPVEGWTMPTGLVRLEVCDPSGLLPTSQCPSLVSEVFLEGNQPTSADNLYRSFQINRETGRLATIFTPPELIEERTFLVVPPEAQDWSRQAGLPVPPLDYDVIQAPPPNPNAQFTSPAQFSAVKGLLSLRGSAAGANFLSYSLQFGQGINPTSWVSIGENQTKPVENGLLAEWDTRGLEGLYAVRLQVIETGQRIETAVLQLTIDNTPPTVSAPYPLSGQIFNRSQQPTIVLQAVVNDAVGVQRVEWWLDGRKAGERSQAPFALVWDSVLGEHTLQLRAFDTAGNEGSSEEIKFMVK